MTTSSISKHSAKYHKLIRDEAINHIFRRSRILLREFTVPQAITRLQQIAVSIKRNLITQDMRGVAIDLAGLHSIAAQYYIIDYLLSEFSFTAAQNGQADEAQMPLNCTLIDIFLLYIRENDEIIRQECVALLYLSVEQIRRAKKQGKNEQLYKSQMERILEQFPYDLLNNCSEKNTIYLLNSLQEIVLLQDYWHKNQSFQSKLNGILKFVSSLISENMSKTQQLMESAVNTALIFLYHAKKQSSHSLPSISRLKEKLKAYLINKMEKRDYCDIDFKRLKVLILSRAEFTPEQLQTIQGLIESQIKKQNYFFFEALNILIHYTTFTLQLQSVRHLLHFLFDEHSSSEDIKFAQMVASLNFRTAKLYKERQQANYKGYLLLMIHYADIDTIQAIIQQANPSNCILTEQITSTLAFIEEDAASIDACAATRWSTLTSV